MAAPNILDELVKLAQKAAKPGPLARLLNKDSNLSKTLSELLKVTPETKVQPQHKEQPAAQAAEEQEQQEEQAVDPVPPAEPEIPAPVKPVSKPAVKSAAAGNNHVVSGILGVLNRLTSLPFAELARENIGKNVLITTTQEIVEGVVEEVGSGYAVLTEPGGDSVIVNFKNTQAFQPAAPAEEEAE